MNKLQENKNYLSQDVLEKQEHLSKEYLVSLIQTLENPIDLKNRPKESFIDLMEWTENTFSANLKDSKSLERFVHNRIIIDGQFLQFCKENSITVECLYKDSVVSWKTDYNYEKFFAQGVFLIKAKGVEFIHAALFHLGNQHESEISFFIICSNSNYEGYVKLRNQFDEWIQERDRSNLRIRVVDGEDLPYTKDSSWEDSFFA